MDLATLAADIQAKAIAIGKTREAAIKAQAELDAAQNAYTKARTELAKLQTDLHQHLTTLTSQH